MKKVESLLGRVVYFHNTIDSHFFLMGMLGVGSYHFLVRPVFGPEGFLNFLLYALAATVFFYFVFKLADFHLSFLFFGPIIFYFFFKMNYFDFAPALSLTIINVVLFFLTQFIFFGLVYIIILKDWTIPLRLAFNSFFTLAPASSSFWVCLFFTSLFSLTLIYQPKPLQNFTSTAFFSTLLLAGMITRFFVPKNRDEHFSLPAKKAKPLAKRVILLNIDGCSFKKFSLAKKPYFEKLKKKAVFFKNGGLTIYRGLTNAAFASILTGSTPDTHGAKDNNIGSHVKIRALPDIVKTIIYGSIHMQHLSKKNWCVRVVSLAKHGFRADDVVFGWLKKDIQKNKETRLFVVDLSSVDTAGHGYGSYSRQYTAEIERADKLIGKFLEWLKRKGYLNDSIIIISSDHGMKICDHAYLLFSEEKEVPLLFYGPGIKRGVGLNFQPSIMDLAPTISFALGIDYPEKMKARVLKEIFE